jgi:hypothetical protein
VVCGIFKIFFIWKCCCSGTRAEVHGSGAAMVTTGGIEVKRGGAVGDHVHL